jgi:hypothetical protein
MSEAKDQISNGRDQVCTQGSEFLVIQCFGVVAAHMRRRKSDRSSRQSANR